MPYIRRLPSGKWQATVRDRSGQRHTKTHALKSAVKDWAAQQEAAIARGEFRDPHLGEIRLGDWHERVTRARRLEPGTRAKNASYWRTHCEADWARWPMGAVTRMEAQAWVDKLTAKRPALGAATIATAVHQMSTLYRLAMREHPPLVAVNPFAGLDLPKLPPRPVDFYEHAEAEALYEAAGRWRTLIELGMRTGLRTEEIFGLHGHRVDWLRGRIEVVDVMTRAGPRQYPKSKRSHRVVPVPGDVLGGMRELMAPRDLREFVFTSPEGHPLGDVNFRNRAWYPAVRAAGIRRFPPRIMRHTAASWLVQAGVPLYDVQKLLGHESSSTTERYAHLAPDAHDKVLNAWALGDGDAPVTHTGRRRGVR